MTKRPLSVRDELPAEILQDLPNNLDDESTPHGRKFWKALRRLFRLQETTGAIYFYAPTLLIDLAEHLSRTINECSDESGSEDGVIETRVCGACHRKFPNDQGIECDGCDHNMALCPECSEFSEAYFDTVDGVDNCHACTVDMLRNEVDLIQETVVSEVVEALNGAGISASYVDLSISILSRLSGREPRLVLEAAQDLLSKVLRLVRGYEGPRRNDVYAVYCMWIAVRSAREAVAHAQAFCDRNCK